MTPDGARRLALALPGAVEQDHHGRPSFRVGGKIFATLAVDLERAPADGLAELLTDAWEGKAPATLRR